MGISAGRWKAAEGPDLQQPNAKACGAATSETLEIRVRAIASEDGFFCRDFVGFNNEHYAAIFR